MKRKRTVYAIVALDQIPEAESYHKMLSYSDRWRWTSFDCLHTGLWAYASVEDAKETIVSRGLVDKFNEHLTVIPVTVEMDVSFHPDASRGTWGTDLRTGPAPDTELPAITGAPSQSSSNNEYPSWQREFASWWRGA